MNRETVEISKVIQKSPEDRTKTELDRILPYLATRSQLLNKLKTGLESLVLSVGGVFSGENEVNMLTRMR